MYHKALERPTQYTAGNWISLLQGGKCLDIQDDGDVRLITSVMSCVSPDTGKLSIPEAIEFVNICCSLPRSVKDKFRKIPENLLTHIYHVLSVKKAYTLPGDQFVTLLEALPTCGGRHNRLLELLTVRSAKMLRSCQFEADANGRLKKNLKNISGT